MYLANTIKTWTRSESRSTFSKFVDSMKKQPPLRERISYTIYMLKVQKGRLDQDYQKMQGHYNKLFRKCTTAVLAQDTMRANIYANECAEVRKMCHMILRSQFAIEQVTLRLETVEEFGDIAVDMNPISGVISSIRGSLAGVVPEVSYTLGDIGNTLNDLVMEAGGATTTSWNVTTSGEEANQILSDASAIADQKMKERFPTLPDSGLPSLERSP